MLRALRIFAEFLTAFAALILLVAALVIWRLSSSPINSTFLTPYIEAGIERYIPDAHAQIAHTLMTWDKVEHSVTLHAEGLQIKNAEGHPIADVPTLDVRLSLLGLVVGQFWPIEMTIDHPQIKLDRHRDGKLYFASLSTGGETQANEADNSRAILQATMRNLTHAYAMRHLMVYRAAVAVHDDTSNSDWSVSIPEIALMRNFTQLTGDIKLDLTQKDHPASLELHYAYDAVKPLHRVSTRFQDLTPAQLVGGHPETLGLDGAAMLDLPLSGEFEVAFDPNLTIVAVATTMHGGNGFLRAPALWDNPRWVSAFDIEGDFDSTQQKLNIPTAIFNFGGATMNVTVTGQKPEDPKHHDLDFTLKARLEHWPMDGFADLWPKPIVPDARDWMVANISKGMYDSGVADFNGSLAWADLAAMDITAGQGHVSASHGRVTYIDGMPPVEDVHAEGDFTLDKMSLTLSDGSIGALHMKPFTAVITGLSGQDQFIDIPVALTGPIPDIIRLIDHPPLRYASAVGLTPDSLSGMADGTVHLHFPLIKTLTTKDIDVTGAATLSNVASTRLVRGIDLSAGDLTLDLDKDGLSVKGALTIDKIPAQVNVRQNFEVKDGKPLRHVNLTGIIKDNQWKMLGDDFAGTRGTANATLDMTQTNKVKTQIAGDIDLAGTELHFASLNWKKPGGASAVLQFRGQMVEGRDTTLQSITLHGVQIFAQGKAVIGPGGLLKSASFAPLRLGRTNANFSYSQSEGANGSLRFDASGKSLDVSGIKGGRDPGRADPRPKEYHLNVEKLYTGDDGLIANAEGYAIRDPQGWSSMSLHGLADGDHKLDIELTPQPDGTRSFSLSCDDFGKMLKGLGITDTVKDGSISVFGASAPDHPRVIDGTVKIGSFSVGKLPVLMLLLNATSPFGFSGLVTDSASFEHLTGTFRWDGDEMTLQQVNAAGSSVGMNIEGKVNLDSGRANLNGTLVPFSMVNRMLGSIPVLGDILTGGNGGGVLAVAYDIKGSLSKPDISVNPVSLLTPGFLRNLFFGGGDNAIPPEEPAKP